MVAQSWEILEYWRIGSVRVKPIFKNCIKQGFPIPRSIDAQYMIYQEAVSILRFS